MPIVSLELATAVAGAGGLAMFSGLRASAAYLVDMLDQVASRTATRAGVNFIIRFLDKETLKAVAPHAGVVEFFYGDPDPTLVELAHAGGALSCWHVGSKEEAIAAERAGCDLIAAQGIEAGGHVRGSIGLSPLLGEVLDVGRYRHGALHGRCAGRWRAVRAGTRFLAAQESDAHPSYVEALIRARAEDTILTETFFVNWPNAPHRVLRSCVEAAKSFVGDMVGEGAIGSTKYPVQRFARPTPNRATVGDISAMAHYAGHSVNAVRRVQPAAEIVRELCEGAEQLLHACAQS